MADHDNLQAALGRLDAIHPTKLPVTKMKDLQESLHAQLSALADRAAKTADQASSALANSDPQVLEFVVAETAKLRAREEELDDLNQKLEDHIQKEHYPHQNDRATGFRKACGLAGRRRDGVDHLGAGFARLRFERGTSGPPELAFRVEYFSHRRGVLCGLYGGIFVSLELFRFQGVRLAESLG